MSQEWRLRLYYGGILLVVVAVMVAAPILIVIVVPLLLAITEWSVIAHVAGDVLDTTHQRDAVADSCPHPAKRRRIQRRKVRLTI
ncbi:hypothetical protein CR155_20375 [Pollutimonas nitritireducens]|uniref:Transmembrane protein n=1 Tax=Pollutimonas nitritireducens TaxID=2045209 RepID=A0A2N4UAG0_9BURK|nr:hypothetical protein CR155_20375 [Pollutimonas nitritireducens]